MRRTARPCDDGAQTTVLRDFSVGKHVVRHAMGRNHTCFKSDPKFLENLGCVLHGVPIRIGTHDDTDLALGHDVAVCVSKNEF
jgi:hypothetical protein